MPSLLDRVIEAAALRKLLREKSMIYQYDDKLQAARLLGLEITDCLDLPTDLPFNQWMDVRHYLGR